MTDSITDPIAPDVLDPAPLAPIAGDAHDDDAAAYEGDFEAAPHAPIEYVGVPFVKDEIKPATRLLSYSAVVGTVNGVINDPIMLMPADLNRKNLTLFPTADTVLQVVISDSKSGCYNGISIPVFCNTIARAWPTLDLTGHTGPVWVYSPSNAPVTVVGYAVTE